MYPSSDPTKKPTHSSGRRETPRPERTPCPVGAGARGPEWPRLRGTDSPGLARGGHPDPRAGPRSRVWPLACVEPAPCPVWLAAALRPPGPLEVLMGSRLSAAWASWGRVGSLGVGLGCLREGKLPRGVSYAKKALGSPALRASVGQWGAASCLGGSACVGEGSALATSIPAAQGDDPVPAGHAPLVLFRCRPGALAGRAGFARSPLAFR